MEGAAHSRELRPTLGMSGRIDHMIGRIAAGTTLRPYCVG